jgi:hypothetical protein
MKPFASERGSPVVSSVTPKLAQKHKIASGIAHRMKPNPGVTHPHR